MFVCNFTPVVYSNYKIGVQYEAFYKEILNSDSEAYGGSNVGNMGGVYVEHAEYHNRPYTLKIQVPPLAMLVFKPEQYAEANSHILYRLTRTISSARNIVTA